MAASRSAAAALLVLLSYLATVHAVEPATASQTVAASQNEGLKTGTFKFVDVDVYYQMLEAPVKPDQDPRIVLFLHGAAYSSDTWVGLGTLQLAQKAGFRAVAVDMPGYGKTKHLPYVDNNMRAEFIKGALEFALQGKNGSLVLVSPSMSGRWAIPFLDRYGTMLAGWVPVAPVGVTQWKGPWEYTHKQVHLLAVYGERDPMKDDATNLLKLFGNSRQIVIPDAEHACYMQQPKAFHDAVIPFMRQTFDIFAKDEENRRKLKAQHDGVLL